MADPKWCHICSGSGIDRSGNDCLCRFDGEYQREKSPTFTGKIVYPKCKHAGVMHGKICPNCHLWIGIESRDIHLPDFPEVTEVDGLFYVFPQLPSPKTLPDVTYIPVAPDDHAELIRKSDLYNECKAVIERLSCEIEGLKKRFV